MIKDNCPAEIVILFIRSITAQTVLLVSTIVQCSLCYRSLRYEWRFKILNIPTLKYQRITITIVQNYFK